MAETTLIKNTLAIGAAASWADATGFADAAELAIVDSQVVHTDLDTTGDTTNGINYLHIRRGTPELGPANGSLKIEFDATYTTLPNFVYDTDGGVCYLEIVTNACPEIAVSGSGTLYITASGGGSLGTLRVSGSARVLVLSTCDITVKVQASGRAYVWIEHRSADNVPDADLSGSCVVDSERRFVAWEQTAAAVLNLDNQVGTAATTATINGGTFNPIRGSVATVNHAGGVVNEHAAKYALTLGSTAYNLLSSEVRQPNSNLLCTVSNVAQAFKLGGK